MPLISKVHHVAIICSDYARSLRFYTQVLGLEVLAEHYRAARRSYKSDLALNGEYVIELFSFPSHLLAHLIPKPPAFAIWLLK